MPRRPLFLTNNFPYHVTSRSNNKEWFYIPIHEVWEIFNEGLLKIVTAYEVHIFAFVLMSNHFHLILETPRENIGDVMRDLLTFVSKRIQKSAQRINHVFGTRYKWTLLDSPYANAYVLKYVLRNPVRAGMIKRIEDYSFSSAHLNSRLPIVSGVGPLWSLIPKERGEWLRWLNVNTDAVLEKQIHLGLRRFQFEFSKDNKQQKAIRELEANYLL
ncbi:MAG: transposase [Pseudomonadota bacterium]